MSKEPLSASTFLLELAVRKSAFSDSSQLYSFCRVQLSSDLPQALPLVQLQGAVDLPGPVDGVCVARVVGAYCCGWWLCRCVTSWSSSHSSMSLFRSMKLLDLHSLHRSMRRQRTQWWTCRGCSLNLNLQKTSITWLREGLHCPHDRCLLPQHGGVS